MHSSHALVRRLCSLSVGSHVTDSNSLKVNLSFLLESLENFVGLLVVACIDES
jgi:hypothetical protein